MGVVIIILMYVYTLFIGCMLPTVDLVVVFICVQNNSPYTLSTRHRVVCCVLTTRLLHGNYNYASHS
jgi:hypothetical protein